MKNRVILIGICIVAVGLIALPQTLALFAGQHNFYEITQDPSNLGVPCVKCHADVYSELSGSGVHSNVKCEGCHVYAPIINGAKLGGTGDIHAAATPACLDCHGGELNATQWHTGVLGYNASTSCSNCHGTDMPTFANATSILYGANESHIEFASNASSAMLLKGANEACVGCHTHVNVNITWQKPTDLSFNASVSPHGVWNVTDFTAGGMKETKINGSG